MKPSSPNTDNEAGVGAANSVQHKVRRAIQIAACALGLASAVTLVAVFLSPQPRKAAPVTTVTEPQGVSITQTSMPRRSAGVVRDVQAGRTSRPSREA